MSLVDEELRRKVLGGTTKRVRLGVNILGEPKVGDLQVAARVQQDVFRLEVAVANVLGVQVLQDKRDLGGVELGLVECTRETRLRKAIE